jgi:hypothetical protein
MPPPMSGWFNDSTGRSANQDDPSQDRNTVSGRADFFRLVTLFLLCLAVFSAIILVALRVLHLVQPASPSWTLKSAVPLILIGASFACYQFAVSRTPREILTGLALALAFILWGSEQYLSNRSVISAIDDMVVFLFVLDLSLLMYAPLRRRQSSRNAS